MDLSDKALNLLGKLNELKNVPDIGLELRLEIVSLNGTYQKLLDEAKFLGDSDTLNLLKLYKDNQKELIKDDNLYYNNSDELYF